MRNILSPCDIKTTQYFHFSTSKMSTWRISNFVFHFSIVQYVMDFFMRFLHRPDLELFL